MKSKQQSQKNQVFPSISSEKLLKLISEHTATYNEDNSTLPVKLTEKTSHIVPKSNDKKPEIHINPINAWRISEKAGISEKQALRLLMDTLSHEVAHHNHSELESKREFVKKFKINPKIAGAVINIVEDCYIDRKRLEKFDGLKKPFKIHTDYVLPDHRNHIGADGAESIIALLTVVFRTNKIPEEAEKSEYLKEMAEYFKNKRKQTIQAEKQEERLNIAEDILKTIIIKEDIEEMPEIPEELKELLKDLKKEIDFRKRHHNEEEAEKRREELKEENKEDIPDKLKNVDPEKQEEEEKTDKSGSSSSSKEDSESEKQEEEEKPDKSGSSSSSKEDSDSSDSSDSNDSGSDKSDSGSSEKGSEKSGSDSSNGSSDSSNASSDSGDKSDDSHSPKQVEGEKKEERDIRKKEYSKEKFQNSEIPGGFDSQKTFLLSEESREKTQKTALNLSNEIKERLEDMRNKNNDSRIVKSRKGKNIDIKRAIRRKAGDKTENKLFNRERKENPSNNIIGITMDGSGSMRRENRLEESLKAAAAIGEATKIKDDDITINQFYSFRGEKNDSEKVKVEFLTEIGEKFDIKQLNKAALYHREPAALGIEKTVEEMDKSQNQGEKILFVILDGNPTIKKNGKPYKSIGVKEEAVNEISDHVEEARDKKIKVIGIGVGSDISEWVMDNIFGEDWFKFDSDTMAEKMLSIYRNQV